MSTILGLREGFPQDTYDRCARHANFRLHVGAPWLAAHANGARVELQTPQGPFQADYAICGTGVDMDFSLRPELGRFAANIATWADRYAPPPDQRNDRLGRYPYLGREFELTEKTAGETAWIRNIHVFAIASTMSFGPSGSSINAMTTAVRKLVDGITRGLFKADVQRHWRSLQSYDVPQAVLSTPPATSRETTER